MTSLVVVKRNWDRPERKARQKFRAVAWTLHRSDCSRLKLITRALPAPDEPYPNTVSCRYCCPLGEPPLKRTPKPRKPPPPPYSKPRGHLNDYVTAEDGTVTASCCACSIVVTAVSIFAAKRHSAKAHRAAEGK